MKFLPFHSKSACCDWKLFCHTPEWVNCHVPIQTIFVYFSFCTHHSFVYPLKQWRSIYAHFMKIGYQERQPLPNQELVLLRPWRTAARQSHSWALKFFPLSELFRGLASSASGTCSCAKEWRSCSGWRWSSWGTPWPAAWGRGVLRCTKPSMRSSICRWERVWVQHNVSHSRTS